jgi:hypothetical protein
VHPLNSQAEHVPRAGRPVILFGTKHIRRTFMKKWHLTSVGVPLISLLLVAGCDSGSDDSTAAPSPTEQAAAQGATPDWAYPVNITGDLMFTVEKDGLQLDVYEAGRATTATDSSIVDEDTGESLWPAGSPIVFVTYVVTNTTDKSVFLNLMAGMYFPARLDSLPYGGTFSGVESLIIAGDSDLASDAARELGIRLGIPVRVFPKSRGENLELGAGQYFGQSMALPLKVGEKYTFEPCIHTHPRATGTHSDHETVAVSYSETYVFN